MDKNNEPMKICTKCDLLKPLSEFCNRKASKDGLSYLCRECRNKEDKERLLSSKLLLDQAKFQQENTHKICVDCKETKSLEEFCKSKKSTTGYSYNCKKCKNLYRKEEINSLEFIANQAKFQQENTHKICTECGNNKFLEEFYKDKGKTTGLSYNCKECEKEIKSRSEVKKRKNERNRKRRIEDPSLRLSHSMSSAIYSSLKGNKEDRSWESLVPYTQSQLRSHLISKFEPGMTMENYGRNGWHIDHIIPGKYQNPDGSYYWDQDELADENSETFRGYWALENLQPMWEPENISKGSKYIGKHKDGQK